MFLEKVIFKIIENLNNIHFNNYDVYRFKRLNTNTFSIYELIEKFFYRLGYINKKYNNLEQWRRNLEYYWKHIERIDLLYNNLTDEKSKDILVNIFCYKILGNYKVIIDEKFEKIQTEVEKIRKNYTLRKAVMETDFLDWKLDLFKFPFKEDILMLYYVPYGIYSTFFREQYRFSYDKYKLEVEKDDIIIDGGGCWGDTALYFASQASDKGHVYSFEFVPENIKIFKKNLSLNKKLSSKVTLVERALWDQANETLYFDFNGPGTSLKSSNENNMNRVETTTIDSLCEDQSLSKISIIKLDIEGAEYRTLKGAENVLKKFKPKLAISLYHNICDFYDIPKYLIDLNLGYNLFLRHHTIHNEETVLYAI